MLRSVISGSITFLSIEVTDCLSVRLAASISSDRPELVRPIVDMPCALPCMYCGSEENVSAISMKALSTPSSSCALELGWKKEIGKSLPVPVWSSVNGHTFHGHMVDRKSTRLNSSHVEISYAVFCL